MFVDPKRPKFSALNELSPNKILKWAREKVKFYRYASITDLKRSLSLVFQEIERLA